MIFYVFQASAIPDQCVALISLPHALRARFGRDNQRRLISVPFSRQRECDYHVIREAPQMAGIGQLVRSIVQRRGRLSVD